MPTHAITSDNTVETTPVRGGRSIYLARGCSYRQLQALRRRTIDDTCGAPSDDQAIAQVAEQVTPDLVEFTANLSVAQRFGRKGWIIVVRINRKYLTRGSVSEQGWVAFTNAPFEIIEAERGAENKPGRIAKMLGY